MNAFRGERWYLSNMFVLKNSIPYEGLKFLSVENAYQAAKTTSITLRSEFQNINAYHAKAKGKNIILRNDWNYVKVSIMRNLVRAKFACNPELSCLLLGTKDEMLLHENDHGDVFWGTVNGNGLNYLGLILMQIRKELREGTLLDMENLSQ